MLQFTGNGKVNSIEHSIAEYGNFGHNYFTGYTFLPEEVRIAIERIHSNWILYIVKS